MTTDRDRQVAAQQAGKRRSLGQKLKCELCGEARFERVVQTEAGKVWLVCDHCRPE